MRERHAVARRDLRRQAAGINLPRLRRACLDRLIGRVIPARHVTRVAVGEDAINNRGVALQELKRLDEIAYIRFASVYKNFADLAEFQEAIAEVGQPRK